MVTTRSLDNVLIKCMKINAEYNAGYINGLRFASCYLDGNQIKHLCNLAGDMTMNTSDSMHNIRSSLGSVYEI